MSTSENSCEDSDVEHLMYLLDYLEDKGEDSEDSEDSSDGWSDSESSKVCPCGLTFCQIHLIDGDFVKLREIRAWAQICTFPKGHETSGFVREGFELETLRRYYAEGYKITSYGNTYEVQQLCPCKKLFCTKHIFPATVELEYSFFNLAVYNRATRSDPESEILIEPLFRQKHPMTFKQVEVFFDQFMINWQVSITPGKINFKMICKCGKAFTHTPCQPCAMSTLKACHICGQLKRSRMLKKCHESKKCIKCKKICSDCKAAEITFCSHCKKNTRLDHQCLPIVHQHSCFRKNQIRPHLIRKEGDRFGICPDCKESCSYSIYPRHSKRRHNDLSASLLYSRDYEKVFCKYCNYYHFLKDNVSSHMNFHNLKKTYKCKLGCGLSFMHAAQEIQHRQIVHSKQKTSILEF